MAFKFERLEVWQLSIEYIDLTDALGNGLTKSEESNLKSQILRAATSVALNIAKGSTRQTNAEQARCLGMAIRSLLETVACQQIIQRRDFISDLTLLDRTYSSAQTLAAKLHPMRKLLSSNSYQVHEDSVLDEAGVLQ